MQVISKMEIVESYFSDSYNIPEEDKIINLTKTNGENSKRPKRYVIF